MTKKDIIKDLEGNIYCRIMRSKIDGVGVFAIRKIPKGTKPLTTLRETHLIPIPENEILRNKKIPKAVRDMAQSFYATQKGKIYFSAHSLNEIDISYFLNHSNKPNINAEEINEETIFTAGRDIKVGEELTVNYSTFSD